MFGRISAFRLVTQAPEQLLGFYAALGFTIEDPLPISADEMAVLGITGVGTRRSMRLGAARVDLDQYDAPGRRYPADADAESICFQHLAIVTDDVATAWRQARAAGATPISTQGPVTLPAASGGVTAIKFRDPEGHPLELIAFPDAETRGWHGHGTLGIDHSAISVRDIAASQQFYADHGLSPGKTTLNRGREQAMLDGLDDPVATVLPMMPGDAPPHVELLGYHRDTDAERYRVEVNDVAATRIVWRGGPPGLLRDPDGHFHQING